MAKRYPKIIDSPTLSYMMPHAVDFITAIRVYGVGRMICVSETIILERQSCPVYVYG